MVGCIVPLPDAEGFIFFTQSLSLSYTFGYRIKHCLLSLKYRLLRNIGNSEALLILQQTIIHFFYASQDLQ